MKYKLLCTDIDRTFSHQDRIFNKNIEYLKFLKENKIILVANSGRGIISGRFFCDLKLFDYLIGNDGAIVFDLNANHYLFQNSIPKRNANKILRLARKCEVSWVVETNNEIFFSNTDETKDVTFIKNSGYPYSYTKKISCDANRILILEKNQRIFINKFMEKFGQDFSYFSNARSFEITKKGVSKGSTLLFLLDKLKISRKDILVIGDSVNDVSMLSLSKMSVAMGNADKEAKKASSYVTKSEEEEGWLEAVKKYEN